MSTITFVAATEPLKGKRAAVVARMLELIIEAEGDPVTWDELTEGVEHPHQYTPALHSLEMVGAIERWTYSEPGSRKTSVAYSIHSDVQVVDR